MGIRVWGMRPGISFGVSPADRLLLRAVADDRSAAQKHAWRAEIVLLSAEELMRQHDPQPEIRRRFVATTDCDYDIGRSIDSRLLMLALKSAMEPRNAPRAGRF